MSVATKGIAFKSETDLAIMKEAGDLLGRVHGEIAKLISPGATTLEMDRLATQLIKDAGAEPSFLGYNGYPFTININVNDVVVHGFPSEVALQEGDIVGVDCGLKLHGFHVDSAYTYPVGQVRGDVLALMAATYESLFLGIEQLKVGNRLGDYAYAVQAYVERRGYSVVRDLLGHGIGHELHEEPQVPNYGRRGTGAKLVAGMVIAVEPMINMGVRSVQFMRDGWTVRTVDRKHSAHYEHTVAVTEQGPEILTTFKYIHEVFDPQVTFQTNLN